jgi:Amt family ammonium transporter
MGGAGGISFVSQLLGSLAAVAFALTRGTIVYGALRATIGIRLDRDSELQGCDLAIHKTSAYPETQIGY